MFWILLTLSLVCADKLDRTYLPPPGSQYAGGRPGDIQAPLEYSEVDYPGRPDYIANQQIAMGIDRKGLKENNSFSKNSLPQDQNIVSKTTEKPAANSYYTTSTASEYIPNYSSSENPDIEKFYKGQNGRQFINNIPERYLPNGQIYPGQVNGVNYPARPQYIDNQEIAIGIDRKGPKEISDIEKNINLSKNSLPQDQSVVSKTTARPVGNNYFMTSSTSSDYIPNYSSSENPDIAKFYNGQNERQNINTNFREKYLPNGQIYPGQLNGNSYTTTGKPITNNEYASTFQTNEVQNSNAGDLDGLISLPCSNTSLTKSLTNDPCIFNSNGDQDLSTLIPMSAIASTTFTPTTMIPNYSERQTSGYSSTTKRPFNTFDIKRPERIQAQSDREAVILNYENVLTPEGYAYSFDTSNGIHGDESGVATDGVRAKGSYSYIGDDGKVYRVIYTADENGFRPEGDHLPTSPPIPDAILKVIEKAYEDKRAGIIDDGSYDDSKYGYKKYNKDFYKPSLFKPVNGKTKINADLITKDEVPFNPNQQNLNLKYKQNGVSNPNKKNSRPNYINNYYDLKNSSTTLADDYKDIDKDDDETDYEKIDSLKPMSQNLDDQRKKNMLILNNNNQKYNEQKNLSPTTYPQIYNESGSPYYSSQNENVFPTRFSEIYNNENEDKYQKNTNERVKPFMTPYVMRNDDDEQQNYDSKENMYNEPNHYFNDEIHQKYSNDNYPVVGPNTNEQSDVLNNSEDNDDLKSTHNGYFYPKGVNTGGTSFKHFTDPNLSYTPTNGPFEFPTRSSTIPDGEKYYSGTPELIFRSSTTPSPMDTSNEYQTSSFPSYSPKSVYKNMYEETKQPNYNTNYYSSTAKNIGTDIPKFAPSYSPSIDIMNSDTFKIPSSTERVIGEDFSGPKRPQSFNSLTGYQY